MRQAIHLPIISMLIVSFQFLCFSQTVSDDKRTGFSPRDGDREWKEVLIARKPSPPPIEWRKQRPSHAEMMQFIEKNRDRAKTAADSARDFYTNFPDHSAATDAITTEFDMRILAGMSSKEELIEEFSTRAKNIHANDPNSKTGKQLLEVVRDKADSRLTAKAQNSIKLELQNVGAEPTRVEQVVGSQLTLKAKTIDGSQFTLPTRKIVIVYFWTTWSGRCQAEAVNIQRLYEEYHKQGVDFLGINFDTQLDRVQQFVKEQGITWPQVSDGKGWNPSYLERFGVTGGPVSWVIDRNGVVRAVFQGGELRSAIQQLLAQ